MGPQKLNYYIYYEYRSLIKEKRFRKTLYCGQELQKFKWFRLY